MSKSKGNTVPPERVIERYGADVTRLHLLFMGPFEANTVWEVEADGHTPQHIEGVRRFLHRVWRLFESAPVFGAIDVSGDGDLLRAVHRSTAAVTEQIEVLHFNIAISELMTCVSHLEAHRKAFGDTEGFQSARTTVLKLLAPFAPFITEELWARSGLRDTAGSIHRALWPVWNPDVVQETEVEMAVLIDNRVRDHITVAADASEEEVRRAALDTPAAEVPLSRGTVRRVIVVPGRLVNIVTR